MGSKTRELIGSYILLLDLHYIPRELVNMFVIHYDKSSNGLITLTRADGTEGYGMGRRLGKEMKVRKKDEG